MGLEPRFTLIADNRDITAQINDRLISLNLTLESDDYSDQLTLVLADTDQAYPIIKPPQGAVLKLSLGYGEALVNQGDYIVSGMEGEGGKSVARTFTIHARAAPYNEARDGATGFQTQKTRSWPKGTTIGAIVQKIAAEHNFKPAVSPALAGIHLQHFDQADESDLSFLQRIARQYDAIAKPAASRLIFVAKGESRSASGQNLPPVTLTETDLSSWRWSEDTAIRPGTVVALYHTTAQARTYAVSIGSGDPVRRLRRKFRNADDARSAATAEMAHRARGALRLNLSLPGSASLSPSVPVILDKTFSPVIQGNWLIKSCIHSMDKSAGFLTSLDCERPNDSEAVRSLLNGPVTDTGL